LVITPGAGLPSRDRSSDRSEQHRAALEHHPASATSPRRTLRSGTCMHLLIAGSPPVALPEVVPSACHNDGVNRGDRGPP